MLGHDKPRCKECGYTRFNRNKCANCATTESYCAAFEEYLSDYLGRIKIKNTNIYIFPTMLGRDKSMSYWTNDISDNFLRYEGAPSSMIGSEVD